jgi:NADPH:quinone reductase-like Zn-dependent oxidoreductase
MDMQQALALWHESADCSVLRTEDVSRSAGDVLVRTLFTGLSRGTERLVASGGVPDSEHDRMRAPHQAGRFPFPVKYGYQAVGVVEDGPDTLIGRHVFSLYPHQTRFAVPLSDVTPLPDGLPPRRAALAANMETALNAVWDSGLSPGDRVAIVGAGALGLLTAAIVSRIPGVDLTLIDVLERRRAVAAAWNIKFTTPDAAPGDCDVAFHSSATAAGLRTAIGTLGFEGALIELSWHGVGETPVPLGGAFHSRRLRIIGSQVGVLPPHRRARWTHARRIAKALEMLDDPRIDALIEEEVPFADLPTRFHAALRSDAVAVVVRYP